MLNLVKLSGGSLLVLGLVALAAGCGGGEPVMINPTMDSSGGGPTARSGGSEWDGTGNREALPEIDESLLFSPDRGLETIYFDYNSYALRSDALDALQRNAEKLKQVPNAVIQIEGHCDERGTQEYNLALGEKRALATREHLINLGISPDRIITISYGEEMPVAMGHDESAWSQNRRCEFNKAM